MKKLALVVLSAFLVCGLFGCGKNVPADAVATVNGEAITQAELDYEYSQVLHAYAQYGYDFNQDDVKLAALRYAMDDLEQQKLLMQEAKSRGLEVTDEEFDAAWQDLVSRMGTEEDLNAAIEEAGMEIESFKAMQRDALLQEKLQMDLVQNPETVDVIQAKHILVDTEEEARDIIAQLDAGADFATLASEKSQDPGSAVEGGELGYFAVNGKTTSKMVEAFTEGAKKLEIGEYSKEPVQSEYGYHIILVEDKASDVNLLENPDNKYDSILQGIYAYGVYNLADALLAEAKIDERIDMEAVPADPKWLTDWVSSVPEDGAAEDNAAEADTAEEGQN